MVMASLLWSNLVTALFVFLKFGVLQHLPTFITLKFSHSDLRHFYPPNNLGLGLVIKESNVLF